MTKLCPACKGRKKTMGMGMMLTDCSTCKALGYVDLEPAVIEIKKRGRRAKKDEHKEMD